MSTDIIIIKGAPASGKSETAEILASHFPKGAKIEVDYIRAMIISVDWEDLKEHLDSLEVAANMAINFLKLNHKPVIVIDTFHEGKEKEFINILCKLNRDITIKIFGLYVNENTLKQRLESRSEDQYKNFTLSSEANNETKNLKGENIFTIDASGKTAEETASIISSYL